MRLRNETLRTGSLLAHFDPEDRFKNRSLLFLISGAPDITPLTRVETTCRHVLESRGLEGFEWHAVPDQGQLATVDPFLDASRVTRVEVSELAGLKAGELEALLEPALTRLAAGEAELFPSAGGAVGGAAEGIQLLGRQQEIEALIRLLRDRQDILLLAPRRSGKTSVLRRLERVLESEYRTVFLDLERDFTPSDASARLRVLATGERYRLAQSRAEEDWRRVLGESLRTLSDREPTRPLLLLLDELVFFLQNLEAGHRDEARHRNQVLAFLVALSETCAATAARVVVAGSLDLGEYLRETLGIEPEEVPPPLGTLTPFPLPPLSLDSPGLEMRRVLLGTGLLAEAGELAWLVENADLATPYAALRFLDHLNARIRTEGPRDLEGIQEALDDFLATTEVFQDFGERLRSIGARLPGARLAVCEVLDRMAELSSEIGLSESQMRTQIEQRLPGQGDRLLAWLLETFPLRREGDRLVFASRLFHRWWRLQFVETRR